MIQFLVPLMTHSSPSWTAVVRIAPGSEPASGSLRQKAGDHSPDAHLGRKRCLSSSEPKRLIGSEPSSWIIRIRAQEPEALAISSTPICSISVPVPVPPYSSENGRPSTSWEASSSRMSHGYSSLASISAARGAILSFVRLAIISRKSSNSCGMS